MTFEIEVTDELNGSYRLYWHNGMGSLDNKYVRNLLRIDSLDVVGHFWTGDVFIVGFSEQPTTFAFDVHDVNILTARSPSLTAMFQSLLEDNFLERSMKQDRDLAEMQEKSMADKEILLQRMLVPYIYSKQRLCIHVNPTVRR